MTEPLPPLIGVMCDRKPADPFGLPNHAVSEPVLRALRTHANVLPVLVPALPLGEAAADTLAVCLDGLVLTGGSSMVAPARYGGPPLPAGQSTDDGRDDAAFALIRTARRLRLPILGICRGLQELNVAAGGTLATHLPTGPGTVDHTPHGTPTRLRTEKAHAVAVVAGGVLATLAGGESVIAVNSLHEQAISTLGPGLRAEAHAPDGTVEALSAPGDAFLFAVQWHPEYDCDADPISRAIFRAFGDAAHRYNRTVHARAA